MMMNTVRSMIESFSSWNWPANDLAESPDPAEKRAYPRHELEIEGRVSLVGTEHRCVIRNISTGGMTVSAPTASVCVGQQVIVDTEKLGYMYGIVRWFRDGNFGIEFRTPMALDVLNNARQSAPVGMSPRAARARVRLPAIAHYGKFSREVEVGNISVGGLMMTSGLPLRPAQAVMIEFPEMMPIGGHVRWAEGGRCGVMFTKLLPISAATEIAHRAHLSQAWLDDVRAAHAEATA